MEKIVIEKSGVVDFSENLLYVNSEEVLSEAMNQVKRARPKQNDMGAFAAKVTLTIELLGDLEGKQDG